MTVHKTFPVTNLATGEERIFAGISPASAVVSAYEQAKGNYNTWAYDYSQAKVSKTGGTVSCGDWTAIISKDKIMAQIRADKQQVGGRLVCHSCHGVGVPMQKVDGKEYCHRCFQVVMGNRKRRGAKVLRWRAKSARPRLTR